MLDIKVIRSETERVKKAMSRRKENVDIDGLLALDEKRRAALFEAEQLKAQQNEITKKIPAMKKAGEDTTEIFAEMKTLSDKIKEYDSQIREMDEKIYNWLLSIPNIPNDTVPDGNTDEDNVEMSQRRIGISVKVWTFWILFPRQRSRAQDLRFTKETAQGLKER